MAECLALGEHDPTVEQRIVDRIDALVNQLVPWVVFELQQGAPHVKQDGFDHAFFPSLHLLWRPDPQQIQSALQDRLHPLDEQ